MEAINVTELVKVYGPLFLFFPLFLYLLKFILDNYKTDIESRTKLSASLDALSHTIEQRLK